ncbi:recombinase family protein [Ahrensia marina]|uniref:recombinase family protein n=1 Tax=Ahrensia marina TaxID=1514904 RepID=UPI0006B58E79|nr:recombinase family protein [Ahrensia marina]
MINCAIYTRKSTEEGLDLAYNSLHAQFDACLAYIKSQKQAGWIYDDAHFEDSARSGSSLDRPALKRLLKEVENGNIQMIVIHKIDRLTRSLSDFCRLAEIFESKGVHFVCVTQHLDTSSSVGRLSLNMLLSFAQFEREIASDRMKDKIRASRRKGRWTGGRVPLGYRAQNGELLIDQDTAPAIKVLFATYIKDKSVSALRRKWKAGLLADQSSYLKISNVPSRGALYSILKNPIYAGKIRCGDSLVRGKHSALIEERIWVCAQRELSKQSHQRKVGGKAASHLLGKITGNNGEKITRSHTKHRNGQRYSYYVCSMSTRGENVKANYRIGEKRLHDLVANAIRNHISHIERKIALVEVLNLSAEQADKLNEIARVDNAAAWLSVCLNSVERLTLKPASIAIQYDAGKLLRRLDESFLQTKGSCVLRTQVETVTLSQNARSTRSIIRSNSNSVLDERDLGRKWLSMLASSHASMHEIAQEYGVAKSTVSRKISEALEVG